MATTDHEIASVLAPVVAGEFVVPYPGRWMHAPYEVRSGRPMIAADPGLSALVVDRDRGTVLLLDEDGELVLNRSLGAFVQCARRYTAAVRTPEVDDDGWEVVGQDLLARIQAIDPGVADDEESFWAVAAEEVGYGMHGSSPPAALAASELAAPEHAAPEHAAPEHAAPEHAAAEHAVSGLVGPGVAVPEVAVPELTQPSRTQLMLAMTEQRREAAFTDTQWRRPTAAADVTVGPPPRRLGMALDAMAQTAALRGRPVPRPEVLVCGDPSDELDGDLLDRLPAVRIVCYLAVPDGSSPAAVARGIRTVALDDGDPTTAILAAIDGERASR